MVGILKNCRLHFNYPHLSMSQIHSALAYYWDYKEEIEGRESEKCGERQHALTRNLRLNLLVGQQCYPDGYAPTSS